jgi:hypothetical protein
MGMLHEDQYKVLIISRSVHLRMNSVLEKVVEEIKTPLFSSMVFFEWRHL